MIRFEPAAIVDALAARLASVTTANGYHTDAGANPVTLGRAYLDADNWPIGYVGDAVLLIMPDTGEGDEIDRDEVDQNETMTLDVIGHRKIGDRHPWAVAAELLADIKQAIGLDPPTDYCQPLAPLGWEYEEPVELSSDIVTVTRTYQARYSETYEV